jgi:GntR family transcriptional repressor for pyruvate dehydrogenase complex
MKLIPIQKQRVYQIIIEQIKSSIERGDLKPGDRLPSERELAESLSVSRSAVREAFSALEASRIIRVQPGVGVFLEEDANQDIIVRLNEILAGSGPNHNLLQLLEVRQALESQAAYLAATRHTEADLQMIRQAYNRLAASVEAESVAAEEDYRFHLAIVEAAHNPMLSETVKLFSDRCLAGLYVSRSESVRIPGKSAEVLAEHEQIMRAIEAKDAMKAGRMMWEHLYNVETRYLI